MGGVEEVLPGLCDVGGVAVVGGLVDENADVEVAGLVCVAVVELGGFLLARATHGEALYIAHFGEAQDGAVEFVGNLNFPLGSAARVGFQPLEEIVLDVSYIEKVGDFM